MAVGRPDDFDPEGWFEAAVRIDQARATNAAFRASVQPAPAVPEVVSMEKLPTHEEVVEVLTTPEPSLQSPNILDVKVMSADDIQALQQRLFGTLEEFHTVPTKERKVPAPTPPKAPNTPPTSSANRFQVLAVEEVSESTSASPIVVEATCERL